MPQAPSRKAALGAEVPKLPLAFYAAATIVMASSCGFGTLWDSGTRPDVSPMFTTNRKRGFSALRLAIFNSLANAMATGREFRPGSKWEVWLWNYM